MLSHDAMLWGGGVVDPGPGDPAAGTQQPGAVAWGRTRSNDAHPASGTRPASDLRLSCRVWTYSAEGMLHLMEILEKELIN